MNIKTCHPLPKTREDDVHSGMTPGGQVTSTGSRLPQDVMEKAARRLGLFGLLSALVHPALYFVPRAVVPADAVRAFPTSGAFVVAMWVAVACGAAIFIMAFSGKLSAALMLDVGLIFEVVV